jgi:hypothetical protein
VCYCLVQGNSIVCWLNDPDTIAFPYVYRLGVSLLVRRY